MTFNDSRRGYDDGYDVADYTGYAYGGEPRRSYDPRWERPSRRYASGDWMRDLPWLRGEGSWLRGESPWHRDSASQRDSTWHRDSWNTGRVGHHWELDGMTSIGISAQSPHSWEDAARRAIADASRTVRGIRHLCVEDMHAVLDEEIGMLFRVHARVWFDDNRRRR